jgi:hypothetical protein
MGSVPALTPAGAYFSVVDGTRQHVERATGGSCTQIGDGTIRAIQRAGERLVVEREQSFLLVEGGGRRLARLNGTSFAFTYDGRLVVDRTEGVFAADADGRDARRLLDQAVGFAGLSGASGLLVWPQQGTTLVDVASGDSRSLDDHRLQPVAGSPDGRWIAGYDVTTGASKLVPVQGGEQVALPVAGRPFTLQWSPDSKWLDAGTQFGSQLFHVPDMRVIDLESMVVSFW